MHPGNVTVSWFSPTYAPSHPQTSTNEKKKKTKKKMKKKKSKRFWTFAINIILEHYICQRPTGNWSDITKLGVLSPDVDETNIINKLTPLWGIVGQV